MCILQLQHFLVIDYLRFHLGLHSLQFEKLIFLLFNYLLKLFYFVEVGFFLFFLNVDLFGELFQFFSGLARNLLDEANTFFLLPDDRAIFSNCVKVSKAFLHLLLVEFELLHFAEIVPILLFEFLYLVGVYMLDYLVEAACVLLKLLVAFIMEITFVLLVCSGHR